MITHPYISFCQSIFCGNIARGQGSTERKKRRRKRSHPGREGAGDRGWSNKIKSNGPSQRVGNVASNECVGWLNLSCIRLSVHIFQAAQAVTRSNSRTHAALLLLPPVSTVFLFGQGESRAQASAGKLKRNRSQPPHGHKAAGTRLRLISSAVQTGTFQYTRVRRDPAL